MARQRKSSGIMVGNCVRTSDITIYTRMGRTIARNAHSAQPERRTRAQFEVRMKTRHANALWQEMRLAKLMFTGEKSAYAQFASLAFRLPAAYVTRELSDSRATLLMPGIPVSDGSMPVVKQRLGEVEGTAALVTNLKPTALLRGDVLRLYTLTQTLVGTKPMVAIESHDFKPKDWTGGGAVDGVTPVTDNGCLALKGGVFADEMKGWALVHISGDRCSSQAVVTRCRYYEQFTSEEAMLKAAESYGGLTE